MEDYVSEIQNSILHDMITYNNFIKLACQCNYLNK